MFKIGDRVKVIDQNISGEIVRWDSAKAVILDDDRADWIEEGDDGTLVFRVAELEKHVQRDKMSLTQMKGTT